MNILVLGATGNTGRQFLDKALANGHTITAIIRDASKLDARDGLTIIQGEMTDQALLEASCSQADAVISSLGIRKKDPADPWSELLAPEDFMQRTATLIVDAMNKSGIKRLVAISSAGIGDSWDSVDPDLRGVIESSNVGKIFRDLNNMEKVLESSGLDTLAVRPVALVKGDATGKTKLVDRFEKTSKITTGDVAQWMLDAVERTEAFAQRAEMIDTD